MRREGWERRLFELIEARRSEPFAWGKNDCLTFALEGFEAVHGVPALELPGSYKTEVGAARLLKRLGHASLEAAATSVLGKPLASVLLAQRGDIAFLDGLMVVTGKEAVGPGADGLEARPLADLKMVWRL